MRDHHRPRLPLSVEQTCPCIAHLARRYEADVKILQCIPKPVRKGTSALARIEGLSGDPDEMRDSVCEIPSVEDVNFLRLGPGVILGMVTTSSCPSSVTALPNSHVLQAVVQDESRLKWTLLLPRQRDLRALTQSLKLRGIGFRIEEVVRLRGPWFPHHSTGTDAPCRAWARILPRPEERLGSRTSRAFSRCLPRLHPKC